jgi:hypothetical protein
MTTVLLAHRIFIQLGITRRHLVAIVVLKEQF